MSKIKYVYFKHVIDENLIRIPRKPKKSGFPKGYQYWDEEARDWYYVNFMSMNDRGLYKKLSKEEAFIELL